MGEDRIPRVAPRPPHVIDTYLDHQRITDGDHDTMTDAAYTAWRADRAQGLVSLLIAETREDVSALNTRARADLILNTALTENAPWTKPSEPHPATNTRPQPGGGPHA